MLPYGRTPIRDRLLAEGRLWGDIRHPDYDFLDPRLDEYYRRLHAAAKSWLGEGGVTHQFHCAREEAETIRRLVTALPGLAAYRQALIKLTAESNHRLFRLVEDSSRAFEESHDHSLLDAMTAEDPCADIRAPLLDLREAFVSQNLDQLVAEVNAGAIRGPVSAPYIH